MEKLHYKWAVFPWHVLLNALKNEKDVSTKIIMIYPSFCILQHYSFSINNWTIVMLAWNFNIETVSLDNIDGEVNLQVFTIVKFN